MSDFPFPQDDAEFYDPGTMGAKIPHGTWDSTQESYEDYLARMGPDAAKALAEGSAFLANPFDGIDLLSKLVEAHRADPGNDDAFAQWLTQYEDIDELGQMWADILAAGDFATYVVKGLKSRASWLHHKQTGTNPFVELEGPAIDMLKRLLLDALKEDLGEQDEREPWQQEEDDTPQFGEDS